MTRRVEDVTELVKLVELKDIVLIELRAARLTGTILPAPTEEVPSENQVFRRVTDDAIEVRLVTTVENEEARFSVDLLVQYSKTEQFDVSDDALQEFVHRVGLMAGYPYVREAVADLSTKLRTPTITLGIIRPDEIAFGADVDALPRDGGFEE